jgi:hypothetical protein
MFILMNTEPRGLVSQQAHIYRWDRQGRKGQLCLVLVRGTMNTCLIKFEDGHMMVTSRNALRLVDSNLFDTCQIHDLLPTAGR